LTDNRGVKIIRPKAYVVSILFSFTIILGIVLSYTSFGPNAESISENMTSQKLVILNFDDGRESQFVNAKPVLDKYGFKATFYIVCNYVENKPGFMDWKQIRELYDEGNDIGSHSMNHAHLSKLSKKEIKFEVGESKMCLEDHGIRVTSFAFPFNEGANNKEVISSVSKYYDLARTAGSPVTYLHCDGWKNQSSQKDCRTFTKNEDLTFANRYSIRGWSHDMSRIANAYTDDDLLKRFINVVNTQTEYNKGEAIKAIPIVIYHRAGDNAPNYNTDIDLFKREMSYLHDNNFQVITMRDLGYEQQGDYLYVKSTEDLSLTGGIDSISNSH
jgi:peptidoglycan/xylan/chitin deacetylase (PgdA/CDA1 family)